MIISVIIPCYKDNEKLIHCLDAINNQSLDYRKFEVIIVNNDPDCMLVLNKKFDFDIKVVSEYKEGSYAARNTGIKKSKGEIVAFTDADCLPCKNWLSEIDKFFKNNQSLSRLAGGIRFYSNDANTLLEQHYEELFCLDQYSHVKFRKAAVTANMAVRRQIFEDVGLFQDKIKSAEDVDWGKRAFKKGYEIIFSDLAYVSHPVRVKSDIITKAKRIAGGHFSIKKEKSIFVAVFYMLALPFPVYSSGKVLKRKDISVLDKIKVISFRFYVRSLAFIECFRVALGKDPARS